jgi:hypothetical protein
MPLVGRWFVFWAVGARLLLAGLMQVARPELHIAAHLQNR